MKTGSGEAEKFIIANSDKPGELRVFRIGRIGLAAAENGQFKMMYAGISPLPLILFSKSTCQIESQKILNKLTWCRNYF